MDLEFLLIPIMESKDDNPWDCGHLSEWAAYSDDVKYYNDEFIEVKIHGSTSILLIDPKTENVIASEIYNKPKHTIDDFIVSSKYNVKVKSVPELPDSIFVTVIIDSYEV